MDFLHYLYVHFEAFTNQLGRLVWDTGISVKGETVPFVVIVLLGTGIFLTLRLGFIQLRHLGHGFAVTSGKYDDPAEPGDVPHFQALTTALSATVGIGNIAGVALAIHWGGPGALFWMWVTAFLGMATKYTEVTLAQKYREVGTDKDPARWEGSVSGGPMYYIERGLGKNWKWMAVFFAGMLGLTAFLTGNAIQANTVADAMQSEFGIAVWITGLVTALVVGAVILGGIQRIGRVTSILAPFMAAVYVLGALVILAMHASQLLPTLGLIITQAFHPTAGVAGTGIGAIMVTMMWGVRRGLFSNEAGQGSAPIAHAAAKTDEPVSEGVVALLEPFIDTILICSMTGLVIIMTGVYKEKLPTEIALRGGDLSYVTVDAQGGMHQAPRPNEIRVQNGIQQTPDDAPALAWHEVKVPQLFTNSAETQPFTGTIVPSTGIATSDDGQQYTSLYGQAVENGAPLTTLGFEKGLPGRWGRFIVIMSVLLFAISTAISWSYYGDRSAHYLFGPKAVFPYKIAFVIMNFIGAVLPLTTIWNLGDIFLGILIWPNLLALLLLSPVVVKMTRSYFDRKPWLDNAEAHRAAVEARHRR